MKTRLPQEMLERVSEILTDAADVQKNDFTAENMMLAAYLTNPKMEPRDCAERYNDFFARVYNTMEYTGDKVIRSFKTIGLGHIGKREKLVGECVKLGNRLLKALAENDGSLLDDEFDTVIKSHPQAARLIIIAMLEQDEGLKAMKNRKNVFRLNKTFAKRCLYDIMKLLNEEEKPKIAPEEYVDEIKHLTSSLNRANSRIAMLRMQMEEQIEEERIQVQTEFIAKLNSARYGCILDMLMSAQAGFRKLRRSGTELPIEISSVPVVTRKLLQFVEDCGIEPMEEVGEELIISSADLEKYEYEGTPFESSEDEKAVKVISPGWEMYEKGIVISAPKVKEV